MMTSTLPLASVLPLAVHTTDVEVMASASVRLMPSTTLSKLTVVSAVPAAKPVLIPTPFMLALLTFSLPALPSTLVPTI